MALLNNVKSSHPNTNTKAQPWKGCWCQYFEDGDDGNDDVKLTGVNTLNGELNDDDDGGANVKEGGGPV